MSLDSIDPTLFAYVTKYGEILGRQAIDRLNPRHVPGKDLAISTAPFIRKPNEPQRHVISGLVAAWDVQRSAIICAEMGTGKTMMAIAGIHSHARGKAYRALLMVPNHLIDKTEREIRKTVPGVKVVTFEKSDPNRADDSYKELLAYADACRSGQKKVHADGRPGRALWSEPLAPEFVILGRNQAKYDPAWRPISADGYTHNPGITRQVPVGREPVVNDQGKLRSKVVTSRAFVCPTCGQPVRNDNGLVAAASDLADDTCTTVYLQEVWTEDRPSGGMDRICPVPERFGDLLPGRKVLIGERTYEARTCGEILWTWHPKPRKWAPARIIQRQCKGLFDYFVLDEMHEEKGADTAQANAAAKLMSAGKRIVGLTGTLIGGFAEHLYPTLFRMAPTTLVEEGFEWGSVGAWNKAYGRIDTIITTKFGDDMPGKGRRGRGQVSMRGGDRMTKKEQVKPGIMPTLFGRHLMGTAMFLSLDEMSDDLPAMIDDVRSLVAVPLDPEVQEAYQFVQTKLVAAVNDLLKRGSMKLLGAFLRTLLDYPDKPFGWTGPYPGKDAVGYWLDSDDKREATYIQVVQPPDLGEAIRPKERALLDLVKKEKAEGRQCWVYVQMTNKRDVQGRLQKLMKAEGITAKVLRSGTVDTRAREAWIVKHGPGVDCMISHPELVSTGLDFFDKNEDGSHNYNFCTIIFYQGDYNVNRVRQAGHRHWRLGQTMECRNYYIYYQGTMQQRQVNHVGEKFAASKQLEGKFTAEGLAALAGDDTNAHMAMARSLTSAIADTGRTWAKLTTAQRTKVIRIASTVDSLAEAAAEVESDADRRLVEDVSRTIMAMPETGTVLAAETPGGKVELSREQLAKFFLEMQRLGLKVEDL